MSLGPRLAEHGEDKGFILEFGAGFVSSRPEILDMQKASGLSLRAVVEAKRSRQIRGQMENLATDLLLENTGNRDETPVLAAGRLLCFGPKGLFLHQLLGLFPGRGSDLACWASKKKAPDQWTEAPRDINLYPRLLLKNYSRFDLLS